METTHGKRKTIQNFKKNENFQKKNFFKFFTILFKFFYFLFENIFEGKKYYWLFCMCGEVAQTQAIKHKVKIYKFFLYILFFNMIFILLYKLIK